ncbi:hypothetical protein BV22DRAFT_452935 [Leucogyrophana mollusca]|uniref:Uncharacterized protein n=1 Tax=Leucogyrophana mollusca TaxID=85980 RepID=A0ACB8BIE3_9AGAM|nr:hypothetical protein BV22DRAFT_452935 [Leucogyrophana mollusca]
MSLPVDLSHRSFFERYFSHRPTLTALFLLEPACSRALYSVSPYPLPRSIRSCTQHYKHHSALGVRLPARRDPHCVNRRKLWAKRSLFTRCEDMSIRWDFSFPLTVSLRATPIGSSVGWVQLPV